MVPIIEIPDIGNVVAKTACTNFKIKSPNDKDLLEQAKDFAYGEGFKKGKMLVGAYRGLPVHQAKPQIRKLLIDNGLAILYSEPEEEVISRSGDVCVVALTDQWFIDYGEPSWRKQVEE